MNFKKTAITSAITLGTLAGSFTLASALTPTDPTPPVVEQQAPVDDDIEENEPDLGGSIQAPEEENVSEADEAASLEGLATISADEATNAALNANPGATLVDVSLEIENGSVVYEVTLTDAAGTAIEVKVDAGNGAVLGQEVGNEDEGEESENASDEADDGVDHQFEGEETGDNGNGVADADDALEAEEVTVGN